MNNLIMEDVVINAQARAFAFLCDNGYLRIYDKESVLLAELRFNDPAFELPVEGLLIANEIYPEYNAKNSGIADNYKIYAENGETLLASGSVGVIGDDDNLTLPTTEIVAGTEITITEFKHLVPGR